MQERKRVRLCSYTFAERVADVQFTSDYDKSIVTEPDSPSSLFPP